ncbi:MAG: helix-turn-helix transcriptional regulator [Acidobacteria bacterium]|nr:helix-turn-helix transcriptional regulator [Acidobacteriota bacterium]
MRVTPPLPFDPTPEQIRAFRTGSSLSRTEVASLLDVSAHTIENYERGDRRPTPVIARKLRCLLAVLASEMNYDRPLIAGASTTASTSGASE